MKIIGLILPVFLAIFLLSCGGTKNFGKQKYTNLKKIKNTEASENSENIENTFSFEASPENPISTQNVSSFDEDAPEEIDEFIVEDETVQTYESTGISEINAPVILVDDETPKKEQRPKYERQRTFGWVWTGIFIASLATTIAMIFIAPAFYLLIILSLIGLVIGSLIAGLILFNKAEKGRQSKHINKKSEPKETED